MLVISILFFLGGNLSWHQITRIITTLRTLITKTVLPTATITLTTTIMQAPTILITRIHLLIILQTVAIIRIAILLIAILLTATLKIAKINFYQDVKGIADLRLRTRIKEGSCHVYGNSFFVDEKLGCNCL